MSGRTYPPSKMHVVFAGEWADKGAPAMYATLKERYAGTFASFRFTWHKLIDGEIAGKAANENYAAKEIHEQLRVHFHDRDIAAIPDENHNLRNRTVVVKHGTLASYVHPNDARVWREYCV